MYHISIISEGDCMKEEIHKAFDDYLERFQSDENVCESIKKLVLEQLGCGSELDAVLRRFLEIAEHSTIPMQHRWAMPCCFSEPMPRISIWRFPIMKKPESCFCSFRIIKSVTAY